MQVSSALMIVPFSKGTAEAQGMNITSRVDGRPHGNVTSVCGEVQFWKGEIAILDVLGNSRDALWG